MTEKIEVISLGRKRRIVPPLEAYVEGPPPEVEAAPLKEEPIPHNLGASELAPTIERLKPDAVSMTQLRVDFDGQVAWVVPEPRYTLHFKKPERKVVDKLVGPRTPEQLKEHHLLLEGRHGPTIERHYREDVDTHYFWLFPPERKTVYRADPYLMAREVVHLKPRKLTIQTISRIIRPPKVIPPAELPWELRITPSPR